MFRKTLAVWIVMLAFKVVSKLNPNGTYAHNLEIDGTLVLKDSLRHSYFSKVYFFSRERSDSDK